MRMQLAQHRDATCHHTAHTFPPQKIAIRDHEFFFVCWGWGVMLLDQPIDLGPDPRTEAIMGQLFTLNVAKKGKLTPRDNGESAE